MIACGVIGCYVLYWILWEMCLSLFLLFQVGKHAALPPGEHTHSSSCTQRYLKIFCPGKKRERSHYQKEKGEPHTFQQIFERTAGDAQVNTYTYKYG